MSSREVYVSRIGQKSWKRSRPESRRIGGACSQRISPCRYLDVDELFAVTICKGVYSSRLWKRFATIVWHASKFDKDPADVRERKHRPASNRCSDEKKSKMNGQIEGFIAILDFSMQPITDPRRLTSKNGHGKVEDTLQTKSIGVGAKWLVSITMKRAEVHFGEKLVSLVTSLNGGME